MKLKRIYIEENSFEFSGVAWDMEPPSDGLPPDPCVLPGCGNIDFKIRWGFAQWSENIEHIKLEEKRPCAVVCCSQCLTIHAITPLVNIKYYWAAPYLVEA